VNFRCRNLPWTTPPGMVRRHDRTACLVLLLTVQKVTARWSEAEIVTRMTERPNRAYFSRLFRDGGFKDGMEVGVAKARFSEHFLADAGNNIRRWFMVEPFPNEEFAKRFPLAKKGRAVPNQVIASGSWHARGIGANTRLVHLPFMSTNPRLFQLVPAGSLDFIYIDSSHMYEPTTKEIPLYWSLLRAGGVLAGHDYCDHGEAQSIMNSSHRQRCHGCYPVPRCGKYTEYGVRVGRKGSGVAKSQLGVVRAVQEWVVKQPTNVTLHFTAEDFTERSLKADGMMFEHVITHTRNPSWFVIKPTQ